MINLRIKNLHKRFGKLTVLSGLNLNIETGRIFAVLGPNGSGKTTLIKCILGMAIPDQGEILLDGENILGQYQYRDRLNYLPQIANFPPNLSVAELLAMVGELRASPLRQKELVLRFGLQDILDKKLGHLSGGTRQKVNLVLAFMFDRELIILDEPSNGLDPIAMLGLKELIRTEKERGKTILITTHIMSLVQELAEEIVFLLDGKTYFQGSVEALMTETREPSLEHAIAKLMGRQCA